MSRDVRLVDHDTAVEITDTEVVKLKYTKEELIRRIAGMDLGIDKLTAQRDLFQDWLDLFGH